MTLTHYDEVYHYYDIVCHYYEKFSQYEMPRH